MSSARPQLRATATIEVPGPDLSAFRLRHLVARGRPEAHEEAVLATDQAALKGVAEKVEADVLRCLPAWGKVQERAPG